MIVCIAEKPSVARDIADVLGAKEKKDGYDFTAAGKDAQPDGGTHRDDADSHQHQHQTAPDLGDSLLDLHKGLGHLVLT